MYNEIKSRWEDYESCHSCFFVGGLLSGLGGLFGGAASAAGSVAAANQSAQAQQNALNFQQGVYGNTQSQLAPYYSAGTNALSNLTSAVGTPSSPGVLTENPWTMAGLQGTPQSYNMPNFTQADFQSSPGYQFQLSQGLNAINNSGNPRTGAVSGNTLEALQQYGTGLANQDWWNWLNNQQNNYNTGYQANNQNYWNQINEAGNQQTNLWNRFLQLALGGQQAATLTGPQAGLVSNIANTTSGIGATQGAGTLGLTGSIANLFNPTGVSGQSPVQSGYNALTNAFNSSGNIGNNYGLSYALNQAQNFPGGVTGGSTGQTAF